MWWICITIIVFIIITIVVYSVLKPNKVPPAEQRWCLRLDFQSLTVCNGLFGRMDKEKGSRDEL